MTSLFQSTLFLIIVAIAPWASALESSTIQGFRDWKTAKIQAVVERMGQAKLAMAKAKAEGQTLQAVEFERQIEHESWNLEVAQDLAITDYFVLYLSQQSQPQKYLEAATRLTPQELAEILENYSKTLSSPSLEKGLVRSQTAPIKEASK